MALLGTRWYYGGYQWGNLEPDNAGQFTATTDYDDSVNFRNPVDGSAWDTYYMPTPYNNPPRWINPSDTAVTIPPDADHQQDWVNFARNVATHFSAKYPNMDKRFYQITWEADAESAYLFDAGNEQLVEIYKLCYDVIHEADPKAVVFGPTVFPLMLANTQDLQNYDFASYIDGFSMHAYTDENIETNGFIQDLRAELAVLYQPKGQSSIPFIETEHGFGTNMQREMELRAARYLLKTSLIILGEGGSNTWNFYLYDFDINGWGLFYGLDVDATGTWEGLFPNAKIAPKPMVPVLAAATYILDGCDGKGFFNDSKTVFTPSQMGYLFTCDHDASTVRVLWDFEHSYSFVKVYADYSTALLYDWMGNSFSIPNQLDSTGKSYFGVYVRNDPIYIKMYQQ
eukprot:Phypoly_transcript_11533.p1 GENE.Phypoly_transcript_11533~~Phypoly_transcript_11533.p1  ORF type:complete len:398 (+),score=68.46 Phypoly_transcript_11533:1-1194(+)